MLTSGSILRATRLRADDPVAHEWQSDGIASCHGLGR